MSLPISDARFVRRVCPSCAGDDSRELIKLTPNQFCRANWTYVPNFAEILGISSDDVFPINQCNACGFVYALLLPSPGFLGLVYERVIDPEKCIAGSENAMSYSRRMRYVAAILDLVQEKDHVKVLDYGCGLGVTCRILNSCGLQTVGFEPSEVRHYATERRSDLYVTRDEGEAAGLGPFDAVICDNVLEHLSDPESALSRIASMCKAGAVVFVSVPNYEKTFLRRQLALSQKGSEIDMTLNPWEHLNYFSLNHLIRMLTRNRFVPLSALSLPGPVDIGLRPEKHFVKRAKNSTASALRMLRYLASGKAVMNTSSVFSRFSRSDRIDSGCERTQDVRN